MKLKYWKIIFLVIECLSFVAWIFTGAHFFEVVALLSWVTIFQIHSEENKK